MGVCMGKDPATGELESDGRFTSQFQAQNGTVVTVQNGVNTTVRFSEPRVPVVFILGGPGSGKITHCDRVVQERHGVAHVNMTDLIQQHIVGNAGLEDFNQMPANNLVQVLMMEMKMAVNASGYLISGYPRSMRDVVEYTEKLHRVDKVILLNWHVKILEKQIEFGAQLGDTVLQLARMELKNYSKNVLAVADYFDQMKKLIVAFRIEGDAWVNLQCHFQVDGERQPTEVYADFLTAIDTILGAKIPKIVHNGSVQNNSSKSKNTTVTKQTKFPLQGNLSEFKKHIIWVIGGPGSNKSLLASNPKHPWVHVSVGALLRDTPRHKPPVSSHQSAIEASLKRGELVANDIVMRILNPMLARFSHVIVDGFPRNVEQIKLFEQQLGLKPPCILVDCSEVELSRSLGQRGPDRGDNDAAAIKNRLTTYRLTTLPTLKILDDQQRLHIVDGDADPSTVVAEFTQILSEIMIGLESGGGNTVNFRKPSTDTIRAMYQEVEEEQ